jgi:glutaredoxin-related protein
MAHTLILYGTEYCHLCDEAKTLLRQLDLTWQTIDIAEDKVLLERYGKRIPVLSKLDSINELDWPFPREKILWLLSC